jgi:uncharacterized protein YhaN
VDDARRQLAAREGSLSEAESALEPAEQKSAEAQLAIARLEGELGVQREAVAREDASTAKALVEERETALSALPEPEQEVTDELREATERHTQVAKGEVRNLELRLRQAEGALEQVGGQYIEEQAEQAREAVAAAAEREREMDVDYGAWNLLRETLKEAESEDAVHLGNALVEPISQRMSALTGGRYGNLSLEPQLQASGIDLGGERREHASLSVGTQEQLATMLRLSIAEALGSFLVLDDQLTQSDPERMGWIRDLLRASAQEIQVVVFTCCPGDYLTTEEMGSAACDNDGARAVDLTRIMTRSLTQGTQVAGPLNPGTSDVAR